MKVALCLSGQLRTFEYTWKYAVENIIKPLNCDVFIHTWSSSRGGIGSAARFASCPVGIDNTVNFLKDNKPAGWDGKLHFVEEDFQEDGHWNVIHPHKHKVPRCALNMGHMFYSIMKSNDLRRKVEAESNIQYDVVIRSRMDHFFINKIPSNELNEVMSDDKLIYVQREGSNKHDFPSRDNHICEADMKTPWVPDLFGFGSSAAMNIYGDLYNHIIELGDKYGITDNTAHPDTCGAIGQLCWPMGPEVLLGVHLRDNNIKVKRSSFRFKCTEHWNNEGVVGRSYYESPHGDEGDIIISAQQVD